MVQGTTKKRGFFLRKFHWYNSTLFTLLLLSVIFGTMWWRLDSDSPNKIIAMLAVVSSYGLGLSGSALIIFIVGGVVTFIFSSKKAKKNILKNIKL